MQDAIQEQVTFQNLDNVPERFGDLPGFGQGGFRGPFMQAQDDFWWQGVIPLVIGAFGELSTSLMKLIKMWADMRP